MDKYLLILYFFVFLLCAPVVYANNVVINEFLVNPSSNKEWVEFYNPSHVDISKYWLDDDTNFTDDIGASKKSLSGMLFNTDYPVFETSSVFNNTGDHVVLFDETGKIVDSYEYTEDPGEDISLGRSPNGTGDFNVLASLTKGFENTGIMPSPTATPYPTSTPTKVPTPTPIKSGPTKEPTPKKSPSVTSSTIPVPSSSAKLAQSSSNMRSQFKTASISGIPTSILQASDSAKNKLTPKSKNNRVLVGGANQNKPAAIAFIGGAILFISCGILIFIRQRNL